MFQSSFLFINTLEEIKKKKDKQVLMGMKCDTVRLGLEMGFKLVAQIQQVSSDWEAVHWSKSGDQR